MTNYKSSTVNLTTIFSQKVSKKMKTYSCRYNYNEWIPYILCQNVFLDMTKTPFYTLHFVQSISQITKKSDQLQ